jgi:hypothetical protein
MLSVLFAIKFGFVNIWPVINVWVVINACVVVVCVDVVAVLED